MQSSHTAKFNELGVASILGVFSSKASPPVSTVRGPYEARFVGPSWLRALAPPALGVLGARGWWGKTFDGDGGGHNLFEQRGRIVARIPMQIGGSPSIVDGKPGIAITYPTGPFPWNLVRGEVRSYVPGLLMAVVAIDLPGLRHLAVPYMLERRRDVTPE